MDQKYQESFCQVYSYKPETPKLQGLGSFYVFAEIGNDNQLTEKIRDVIVEAFRSEFYQHPSWSVERRFVAGLTRVNRKLVKALKEIPEELLDSISLAVIALQGNEVHLSRIGKSACYFVYEDKIKPVGDQDAGPVDIQEPFEDVFSGTLDPGDRIILASKKLTDHIPLAKVQRIVSSHSPKEARYHLNQLLELDRVSDDCRTLILEAEPAYIREDIKPGRLSRGPAKGKKRIPLYIAIGVLVALLAAIGWVIYRERIAPSEETTEPAAEEAVEPEPIEELAPTFEKSEISLTVLNGSGTPGAAGSLRDDLEAIGFTVDSVGDAATFDYQATVIQYAIGERDKAEFMQSFFVGGENLEIEENPDLEVDIAIVVGQDEPQVTDPSGDEPHAEATIDETTVTLQVLNGNGISGAAGEAKTKILAGTDIISDNASTGNADRIDYQTTFIYYKPDLKPLAEKIATILESQYSTQVDLRQTQDYDIVIILGAQ